MFLVQKRKKYSFWFKKKKKVFGSKGKEKVVYRSVPTFLVIWLNATSLVKPSVQLTEKKKIANFDGQLEYLLYSKVDISYMNFI